MTEAQTQARGAFVLSLMAAAMLGALALRATQVQSEV
jgi:hypothetical protein